MKRVRRPLKPRAGLRTPRYPALATRVALLLGMGAASSCGGADGGIGERFPDGTRFVYEGSDAGSAADAGDAGDEASADAEGGTPDSGRSDAADPATGRDAESPMEDSGNTEEPATDGGDTPDAERGPDADDLGDAEDTDATEALADGG